MARRPLQLQKNKKNWTKIKYPLQYLPEMKQKHTSATQQGDNSCSDATDAGRRRWKVNKEVNAPRSAFSCRPYDCACLGPAAGARFTVASLRLSRGQRAVAARLHSQAEHKQRCMRCTDGLRNTPPRVEDESAVWLRQHTQLKFPASVWAGCD